jgi:hypothetical protein
MPFKVVATSLFLLLVTTVAPAIAQHGQTRTLQSLSDTTTGFGSGGAGDSTTGPTNPRGPVQSPDWV